MEKVMLTVQHSNTAARAMYQRMRYVVDESSPDDDAKYDILSKTLLKNKV